MTESIEAKARAGVLWNGFATGISQVISFALGVLLARLLLPEHFGTVAAIIIFTEMGHSITSSGIVTALVQRKEIREEHYSTALTVQASLAIAVFLTLLALSPRIGLFFRNGLIGEVLAVTSISVLILPFVSIPTAILRKQIDFRSTGMSGIGQQLSNGLTSVTLAYFGWGVWSIVYGRLAGFAVQALHLAYLTRWRPRFRFDRQAGRDLFTFSVRVVLVNILNDIANNVGNFVVGRLLGPTQLGFYHRAYYLMSLPVSRISETINVVVFSAFSAIQDDPSRLRAGLLKATCYVSLIAFPALVGLFWVSPAFIPMLYGEKWMPTVVPLQILTLAGILVSVEPTAVSAIIAKGSVVLEVRRQFVYVAVLLITVSFGSYWGIPGVAYAVLLTTILSFILLQRLLKRVVGLPFREFAAVLRPAVVACGIMSLVLLLYQQIAQSVFDSRSFTMLVSSTMIGAISYGVTLLFVASRTENLIVRGVFDGLIFIMHAAFQRLLQAVKRSSLSSVP